MSVKDLRSREVVQFFTIARISGEKERYRLKPLDKSDCDSNEIAWRLQEYYRNINGSLIEISEDMRDGNGNLRIPMNNDELLIRDLTEKIETGYSSKPAFYVVVSHRGQNWYHKQFRWLVAMPKRVYFEE
jgi:hypothetical protein